MDRKGGREENRKKGRNKKKKVLREKCSVDIGKTGYFQMG